MDPQSDLPGIGETRHLCDRCKLPVSRSEWENDMCIACRRQCASWQPSKALQFLAAHRAANPVCDTSHGTQAAYEWGLD